MKSSSGGFGRAAGSKEEAVGRRFVGCGATKMVHHILENKGSDRKKMILEKGKKWQQDLAERSRAVFLVRGLLGCTCPEEIFDHYQVRQQVIGSFPAVELIMGERLLVWIIDGNKIDDPEQTLGCLLHAGRTERDGRGLNRFRLVVVGDFLSWEKQWAHLAEEMDPKVHLHVLSQIDQGPDRSGTV